MLNKLKSEKGITGIDLTISLILISIFLSIIVALSMNVSTSLSSKNRVDIASDCITEIMEKIDSMEYANVEIVDNRTIELDENYDTESLSKNIQDILKKEKYNILTIRVNAENYKPEGEVQDLLKKVTVTIIYKLNNENEQIQVTRLKPKYNVDLIKTTS